MAEIGKSLEIGLNLTVQCSPQIFRPRQFQAF
jgi:hypothetical protein